MLSAENETIAPTMLDLLRERGPEKTICPSEVARAIAGNDETKWRLLMRPIRQAAISLHKDGIVEIRRKGKAVDPDEFKGVYRIGWPDQTN